MQNLIINCDWGTSSFRLTLVDVNSRQVISEIYSDNGISDVFNNWKSEVVNQKLSKKNYFLQHLKKEVGRLSDKHAISLEAAPVIISGMACSSIGIEELPYASLPFSIDGSNAI